MRTSVDILGRWRILRGDSEILHIRVAVIAEVCSPAIHAAFKFTQHAAAPGVVSFEVVTLYPIQGVLVNFFAFACVR